MHANLYKFILENILVKITKKKVGKIYDGEANRL